MTSNELREKFLRFFVSRGHKRVPSSSLVPKNDPTVLFTTAGMQQFKPYYLGQADPVKDFGSKNTVSVQKSFRTSDIDEVGDGSHLTFFEMLGNFSFGGYFKEEAIKLAHEFVTEELKLKIGHVSVFEGEGNVPADEESVKAWQAIDPKLEIKQANREDNFWGPTGNEGPCGPTTEVYADAVEIWNIVFNEYYCSSDSRLEPLPMKGVDTGMGLERLAAVVQGKPGLFETDLFAPIIKLLPADLSARTQRIIADHIRASVFLMADGVRPSNKEQGYVLRRLMRRILLYDFRSGTESFQVDDLVDAVGRIFEGVYDLNLVQAKSVFKGEADKFNRTLQKGLKEIGKLKQIDAMRAFYLYETYGLPYEVIKDEEVTGSKAKDLKREEFDEEFKRHQEKSRTSTAGIFKGGLQDHEPRTIELHTITHLLQAALRKVLGEHIYQRGSHVNQERTRFDFSHPEKLTDQQKQQVEVLVNGWIKQDLPVKKEIMTPDEAKALGAIGLFEEKYGDKVSVYTIYNPKTDEVVSREFCGGPHVEQTGQIKGTFKIKKEESVAAGIRRIKGILEQ